MNLAESNIFLTVEKHYRNYGARAKELTTEGKKFMGYVCSLVPLEMITAAGFVPFRIRGNVREPITTGDSLLETIVCPYYRSCFDLSLKERYNFLSGIVIPHACDSMVRSYSVWSYSLPFSYFHFVNIPSVCGESSLQFFQAELKAFKKSLETLRGQAITEDDLSRAIRSHNRYRTKVKTLYDLRKTDPPLISGSELTRALTVGSSLPVDEASDLMDDILSAVRTREPSSVPKGPRILLDGACIDHSELIELIEGLGGSVVADTICNGTRDHFPLTEPDGDPIAALARRYLEKVNCPKTYRKNETGTFQGDVASRFWDIGTYAKEFNATGAILYLYKYCDPFGFEVPARKAFYDSIRIPLLHLEDVYSAGTIGQLKTRVQAFLEMIGKE
jgi:benzoyl-CoA reductase subunit C